MQYIEEDAEAKAARSAAAKALEEAEKAGKQGGYPIPPPYPKAWVGQTWHDYSDFDTQIYSDRHIIQQDAI